MDPKAFHAISYGIYVVSSKDGDRLNGQIANTVIQTASDPPMIAVCLNKENLTHEFVQASKVFAVSVLSTETPMSFIGQFGFKSGRNGDKFTEIDYRFGVTGAPIVLNHGVAYLEGEIQDSLDSVTHTLFIARVVAAEVLDADAEPMTYSYYHQVKRGRSPKTAPTYVAPAKAKAQLPETKVPVLAKWVCTVCGYVYDPEVGDPDGGIAPGTPFDEIPSDWVCPVCGVGKEDFEPAAGSDVEAPKIAAAGGQKWVCTVCGYIYDPAVGDPDGGVAPGTAFEDIRDDWVCPVCGVGKDEFEPASE